MAGRQRLLARLSYGAASPLSSSGRTSAVDAGSSGAADMAESSIVRHEDTFWASGRTDTGDLDKHQPANNAGRAGADAGGYCQRSRELRLSIATSSRRDRN